jgi:hypothetical protein
MLVFRPRHRLRVPVHVPVLCHLKLGPLVKEFIRLCTATFDVRDLLSSPTTIDQIQPKYQNIQGFNELSGELQWAE